MARLKKRKQYGERGDTLPATESELNEYFKRGGKVTRIPTGSFTLGMKTIIDLASSKKEKFSGAE